MPPERRLAAILFTDIVAYTALMAESEEKGLEPTLAREALDIVAAAPPDALSTAAT